MFSALQVRRVVAASVVGLAWTTAAFAQGPFTLTSTTFKDGTLMPRKVANMNPQNPNCVGENVSPQLSWTGVPAGTKSFALLMEDPEGRGGAGVHHWVAYGIPPDVTSFAEGEVSKLTDKYVGGKSTQGVGFYSGPCTPPARAARRPAQSRRIVTQARTQGATTCVLRPRSPSRTRAPCRRMPGRPRDR